MGITTLLSGLSSFMSYAIAILIIWFFFKLLSLPVKVFIKLLWNAIIGGIILIGFNYLGGFIDLRLPINWVSALTVGFLGVPGVIILVVTTILGK